MWTTAALSAAATRRKRLRRAAGQLREGKFPKSRHESYVRLYNELKDLREWDKK